MRDLGLMFFIVVACTLTAFPVLMIAQDFGINPAELQGAGFKLTIPNMLTVFAYAGTVCGLAILAWKFGHRQRVQEIGFRAGFWRDTGVGFLVGLVLAGCQLGLSCAFATGLEVHRAIPEGTGVLTWFGYYVFFLVFFLTLNSFKEELVYRSYVLEVALRKPWNPWVVILGSAVLFSAVHHFIEPFTWMRFLTRMTFGVLLAIVYRQSRSLWSVVAIHSGSNFVFISTSANWKLGALVHLDIGYSRLDPSFPVLVLGLATVFAILRPTWVERLFPQRNEGNAPAGNAALESRVND